MFDDVMIDEAILEGVRTKAEKEIQFYSHDENENEPMFEDVRTKKGDTKKGDAKKGDNDNDNDNIIIDFEGADAKSQEKKAKATDLKSAPPKKDFCSKDGSVCAYHNICYDIKSGSWHTHTSANFIKRFPLLNDSNYTKHSDNPRQKASGCSESFMPQSSKRFPAKDEMIYHKGSSYLVCCWVNQFGHILLQMVASAVHALEWIGWKNHFRSNSINFLVDNRASSFGSTKLVTDVFEFLTKKSNRVLSLQGLQEKAIEDGRDFVCFERLAVGMLHDDLVHGGPSKTYPPQATANMLLPIRDHLEEMYPMTKESVSVAVMETQYSSDEHEQELSLSTFEETVTVAPPECTITFLRREASSRIMGNFADVMGVAEKVFNEPKWSIRTVSFDGPSLESQYLTVRSSMVLVSVSGTGSHMAMFLSEGGFSVEILYDVDQRMKNRHICHVSPNLSCITAHSTCSDDPKVNCKNAEFVDVDIESFKEAIENVKENISDKCDGAQ